MEAQDHKGHNEKTHAAGAHAGGMGSAAYLRLLVMVLLSFAAMYVLMYAMVDRAANIFANNNQLYMAALMAAPMGLIELALMKQMYANRALTLLTIALSAAVLVAAFILIRQQVGVTDRQFLKSMIPHHAGAILMCKEAPVRDPEIVDLCRNIVASQQAEIDQMKRLLAK